MVHGKYLCHISGYVTSILVGWPTRHTLLHWIYLVACCQKGVRAGGFCLQAKIGRLMTPSLKYIRYLLVHKWYVFRECCRLGVPFTGLIHDWHKFLPDEFFPYMENFYGYGKNNPSKPKTVINAFNYSWLKHISRSRHHWEFYVLGFDQESNKLLVFEMPIRRRKEMLADWISVSMTLGKDRDDVKKWYAQNKDRMVLGEETRRWIEEHIG
jgi:hypothetical protein